MKKSYDDNLVTFLRGSWAKNKTIRNMGGNFWGPNRKRCSIMPPDQLKALHEDGIITLTGSSFTVNPAVPTPTVPAGITPAEHQGAMALAKSMTVKDLKWQIANAKKLGIPADMTQIFKDMLEIREITR